MPLELFVIAVPVAIVVGWFLGKAIGSAIARWRHSKTAESKQGQEPVPADLHCQWGKLRFRWRYGSARIDMFLLEGGGVEPLIGYLETCTPEGELIEFEWRPFANWCKRFVAEMAKAKMPEEGP